MTRTPKTRYELFGWDYAKLRPLDNTEVHWYEMWARRTGPAVLELACGTGRLACALADTGLDVVAVDLSPAMLALAQQARAALPAEAQSRLELIRGDMADFDLGRTFDTVIIADNSLRELPTREDLLCCLRCIRRHLGPTGRLLITERRFDPSDYPDGRRSYGWSEPRAHPQTGEEVSRRIELRLLEDQRSVRGAMIYLTRHADGRESIEECPIESVVLPPSEYPALFAEAGFAARMYTDYNEDAPDGVGPFLCFVCQPVRPDGRSSCNEPANVD